MMLRKGFGRLLPNTGERALVAGVNFRHFAASPCPGIGKRGGAC